MKTCDEIRFDNLDTLIREAGSPAKLAERYDCTEGYIKQLAGRYKDSKTGRPRSIGSDTARELEKCMGKPRGWMDNDHSLTGYGAGNVSALRVAESSPPAYLCEISEIAASMAPEGRAVLVYEARKIAAAFPIAKANQRS